MVLRDLQLSTFIFYNKQAAVSVSYTVKTSENGLITFTGLGEGEYTLTEIVAPDGYNLLKGPVQIKVKWTGKSLAEGEIVNDTDTCTWTVQYKLPGDLTWKTIDGTDAANLFSLEIVNKTGIELPSTGGIGTTLFYLIGAILIIGAGVLLVTRRRASSMEE